MNKKQQSYISGLKWVGLKELLFDGAMKNNLDIKITNEDKGILNTTIFYKVKGEDNDIKNFNHAISNCIKKYNDE